MAKTQKKKNRVGKAIGALVLSAVLLAGGGAVGYGAGTHWTFKNNGVQAAVPDGDLNAVNGNVLITGNENESHGIRLTSAMIAAEDFDEYGIDTQAETAQVLTATFTPANTTFQDVTWTVSGGNGNVIVTPVAGSPLQATVAVTGSFSQQAVVTCTSTYNDELTATATVDYLKTPSFSWSSSSYNGIYINSIKDNAHINALPFFDDNSTGTLSATSIRGDVIVYNYYLT